MYISRWPNTDEAPVQLWVIVIVVAAWSTTWTTGPEVEPRSVPAPEYSAVIEWLPIVRSRVTKVPTPLMVASEYTGDPLSKNDIVPAVTAPDAPTRVAWALNVSTWPNTDGLADDTTDVDVAVPTATAEAAVCRGRAVNVSASADTASPTNTDLTGLRMTLPPCGGSPSSERSMGVGR